MLLRRSRGSSTDMNDAPAPVHACAAHADSAAPKTRDPVCGMVVDPQRTPHRHDHGGHAYFFCSAGCRRKFVEDPAKYLRPLSENPAATAAPQGVPAPAGT